MQARPETFKAVQSTVANQLSIDESAVTPSTKFSDLGADSLDTVCIHSSLYKNWIPLSFSINQHHIYTSQVKPGIGTLFVMYCFLAFLLFTIAWKSK